MTFGDPAHVGAYRDMRLALERAREQVRRYAAAHAELTAEVERLRECLRSLAVQAQDNPRILRDVCDALAPPRAATSTAFVSDGAARPPFQRPKR